MAAEIEAAAAAQQNLAAAAAQQNLGEDGENIGNLDENGLRQLITNITQRNQQINRERGRE